jgi:hypothetical protein
MSSLLKLSSVDSQWLQQQGLGPERGGLLVACVHRAAAAVVAAATAAAAQGGPEAAAAAGHKMQPQRPQLMLPCAAQSFAAADSLVCEAEAQPLRLQLLVQVLLRGSGSQQPRSGRQCCICWE